MKVYKYRSNYINDLKLLYRSKIYAPNLQQLNDAFEGIVTYKIYDDYESIKEYLSSSNYEYKRNLIDKLKIHKNYLGIYSMSKTWKNELLWAHYSDSHKGFCIEYELDDMISENSKTIIFPKIIEIEYSKDPPIYTLEGMNEINEEKLLSMLIGTKSRPWKYEKEVRLVFKDNGEQEINNNAIRSIIFGARASDEDIKKTISKMSNKIKYYKIGIAKNYKLFKEEIK
jgi:hypothetical protein